DRTGCRRGRSVRVSTRAFEINNYASTRNAAGGEAGLSKRGGYSSGKINRGVAVCEHERGQERRVLERRHDRGTDQCAGQGAGIACARTNILFCVQGQERRGHLS